MRKTYPDVAEKTAIPSSYEDTTIDESEKEEAEEPSFEANTEPAATSDGSYPYLVIAGAFKKLAAAEVEAKKLKKLGYQTEIVRFHASNYHTVIAARYAQEKVANQLVRQLRQTHRIQAYVHRKRRPSAN